MDFLIHRYIRGLTGIFLSAFYFISFPALSATSSTVSTPLYGAINLAFIFGISIPIIVLGLLYKSKAIFDVRFFIFATLSLMGILFCLAFYEQNNMVIPLVFSMLYLVSVYFSLTSKKSNLTTYLMMISNTMVLLFGATYIALICFFPEENSYFMWVIASGIIVTLFAVKIKYSANYSTSFIYKILTLWLPVVLFSCIVYLWVLQELDNDWFIVGSVICYVIFLLASCWRVALNLNGDEINNFEINTINTSSDDSPSAYLSKDLSDAATNLPNQQQALNYISKVVKSHSKDKFAIVVFKPINFQQVNKILGHQNSDILLLQLAYCLQKSAEKNKNLINFNQRNSPIRIARLRGLHFLVVLQLKPDEANEQVIVENLCHELTQAIPEALSFKSFSLNFELTFGASFLEENARSVSKAIAHAEDALLTAENEQLPLSFFNKDEVIYTETHLLRMERLKQDIVDDKLHWYVQPQTRLRDRKLVGFELLVQWHDENNVPIEFQGFIDTAEHSGEIYLLTKQMITRAFKLILKLQRVSNYETVSIKLLSQYLLEPDLVTFIEKQIATYNVPAKYLVIELPEKVVLSASLRAKNIIDELKSLNVNIAISDFSGSYESLRYIRKMAVHQVKIDCNYLGEVSDEPENAIISSLVDLTQKMNLPLIGTSINDKIAEQAFTLIGGELAQGDIVDKGVDTDKIDTWVNTWNSLYNPS